MSLAPLTNWGDNLGKLQDTETELVLLKKEELFKRQQMANASKPRKLRDQHNIDELLDPDHH